MSNKDLGASRAAWLIAAAALLGFGNPPASASIVGSSDDLGKRPAANPADGESEGVLGIANGLGQSPSQGLLDVEDEPVRLGPPGDYSGNGLVEQSDLDLVLSNWGQVATALPAIWIYDRPTALVDQSALDKVLLNWGKSTPSESPVEVMPEAGSASVAMLLLASVVCARAAYKGIERMRSPAA